MIFQVIKMRRGKKFEKQIRDALSKFGFVYRFRDFSINVNAKGMRSYRIPVPSDFLFLRNGKAYFVECKEFSGKRFESKNLRESQIKYAKEIIENGGKYIFLIHSLLYNRVFILSPGDILVELENRKSIKADKLLNYRNFKMEGKYGKELLNILENSDVVEFGGD